MIYIKNYQSFNLPYFNFLLFLECPAIPLSLAPDFLFLTIPLFDFNTKLSSSVLYFYFFGSSWQLRVLFDFLLTGDYSFRIPLVFWFLALPLLVSIIFQKVVIMRAGCRVWALSSIGTAKITNLSSEKCLEWNKSIHSDGCWERGSGCPW